MSGDGQAANAASRPAAVVMSATTYRIGVPDSADKAAQVSRSVASVRAAIVTCTPSSASCRAHARPMPRLPPNTRAVRFAMSSSMWRVLVVAGRQAETGSTVPTASPWDDYTEARATSNAARRTLQAQRRQSGLIIGPRTPWPVHRAVFLVNRLAIDAGVALCHEAVGVKRPVLVAMGTKPVAGIVMPRIGKPHHDARHGCSRRPRRCGPCGSPHRG